MADSLQDAQDRAALAAAFCAGRDAVTSSVSSLRIPAASLLTGPPRAAPAPLQYALRRHARVTRLSVVGAYPLSAATATAAPEVISTLLSALPSLRRLVHIDLGAAPSAFYERLPSLLLRALASDCPNLETLEISSNLWHAPAQAAVLRALARAAPPGTADCAAACCPAAGPTQRREARGGAGPYRHPSAQQELRLASALLSHALPAQAAREDLRLLGAMQRLRSVSITGSVPQEVIAQLPGLPKSVCRLAINCALQESDEHLGRALGALSGLTKLTLTHLPSVDGAMFYHMTGGGWLPEESRVYCGGLRWFGCACACGGVW